MTLNAIDSDATSKEIPDCLRLAVSGGASNPNRGMTLCMETSWLDVLFAKTFNVAALISSQKIILDRAKVNYNSTQIKNEQDIMDCLNVIAKLPVIQRRHALLDLLVPVQY
jgi:hypothetical protein